MPVAATQPVYPPTAGGPLEAAWGIAASEHVVQRFTTLADRNAKWTTPPVGAICVTTSPLSAWIFDSGGWIPFGGALVGEMKLWPGAAVPVNYLLCDGRSVSRATYPLLFAAIGTTWGSADASSFNLPDMRGRAPIGAGQGTGLSNRALAAKVGVEAVALSTNELPSHAHTVNINSTNENTPHSHAGSTGWQSADHYHRTQDNTYPLFVVQSFAAGGSGLQSQNNGIVGPENRDRTGGVSDNHYHDFSTGGPNTPHWHGVSGNTGLAGLNSAHENMPPSLVVNYIIYSG